MMPDLALIVRHYCKFHLLDGLCIHRDLKLYVWSLRTHAAYLPYIFSFDAVSLCLDMRFRIGIHGLVLHRFGS